MRICNKSWKIAGLEVLCECIIERILSQENERNFSQCLRGYFFHHLVRWENTSYILLGNEIILVTNLKTTKYYYKMNSHEPHKPKTEDTTK